MLPHSTEQATVGCRFKPTRRKKEPREKRLFLALTGCPGSTDDLGVPPQALAKASASKSGKMVLEENLNHLLDPEAENGTLIDAGTALHLRLLK